MSTGGRMIGTLWVVGVAACGVSVAWGDDHVPPSIYYQGQLKQSGGSAVSDGSYAVLFTLYDAETGGTALWSETLTVPVTGGLFHARLGESPGNALSSSLFPQGSGRWLGIKVGSNPEMTPRQKIATVPYAFRADAVVPNSVGSAELKSESSSLSKVSGGAMSVSGSNVTVSGTLSGNGSGLTNLNGSNIATGTVALARLDGGVATDSELSAHASATTGVHGVGGGALVGTLLSQVLQNKTLDGTNSIDGGAIKSGTIPIARIADGAVTSAKIADGTIVDADVSGSAAIAYSKLSGVAAASHTHSYLPLTGGTLTGNLTVPDINVTGGDVIVSPQASSVEGGELQLIGCGGKPSFFLDVYTTGEGGSDHKFRIHSQGKTLFDIDYYGVNVRTDYGLWIDKDLHVFGRAYHSGGCGDVAENVAVDPAHKDLKPGSVVCIDPDHPDRFTLCRKAYDTMVAGIVSADPNNLLEPTVTDETGRKRGLSQVCPTVPLALVGRVDCLADATDREIAIGDLLTSSSTPGHAMKAEPEIINGKPFLPSGVVIGKALSPLPKGQKGTIKVLLTLR